MSAEMITTIVSVVGLLLALASGFAWLIHRMDAMGKELGDEIKSIRQDLGDEIKGVRHELGGEINGVRHELGGEINGLRQELGEVKVAVARLEGPLLRRLELPR